MCYGDVELHCAYPILEQFAKTAKCCMLSGCFVLEMT